MRNLLFALLCLGSVFSLQSQTLERYVLTPAGGSYVSGSNLNIDYTIGEVLITTIGSSNNILTQGFQQPFTNTYVMVEENTQDPVQVFVYPNPFVDQLNIWIDNPKSSDFSILLYDVLGQLVYKTSISPGYTNSATVNLNLHNLPTGNYYLQILGDKNILQTSSIIKIKQ